MSLKVHNFYTKDKISTNRYHNILMQSCDFYVLVSSEGKFRELALQVPKKFHYERHASYGLFQQQKADEYNVLLDYIQTNEEAIKIKWHLEKGEYEDLVDGLKLSLIKNYSLCSDFEQFVKIAALLCVGFMRKVVRSIKKC